MQLDRHIEQHNQFGTYYSLYILQMGKYASNHESSRRWRECTYPHSKSVAGIGNEITSFELDSYGVTFGLERVPLGKFKCL